MNFFHTLLAKNFLTNRVPCTSGNFHTLWLRKKWSPVKLGYQTSINKFVDWTKSGGLKISNEKAVGLKSERWGKGNEPQLRLHNTIQVCESLLYLDIIIHKIRFPQTKVDYLRAKCISANNLMLLLSHQS